MSAATSQQLTPFSLARTFLQLVAMPKPDRRAGSRQDWQENCNRCPVLNSDVKHQLDFNELLSLEEHADSDDLRLRNERCCLVHKLEADREVLRGRLDACGQ
jgi:hypothetical protein